MPFSKKCIKSTCHGVQNISQSPATQDQASPCSNLVIAEDGRLFIIMLLLLGGTFSFLAIRQHTMLLSLTHSISLGQAGMLGCIYSAAALCFTLAVNILIRRSQPLVVLTTQGILLPEAVQLLSWSTVAGCTVATGRPFPFAAIRIHISLADGTAPPEFMESKRVKYIPKSNAIKISATNLCMMNALQFSDMFSRYWRSALPEEPAVSPHYDE